MRHSPALCRKAFAGFFALIYFGVTAQVQFSKTGPLENALTPGTFILVGENFSDPAQSGFNNSTGYTWDGKAGDDLQMIFQNWRGLVESMAERGSMAEGVTDIVMTPNGNTYYFTNQVNGEAVFFGRRRDKISVYFQFTTLVRTVQMDDDGYVYFSVSSGAESDGAIYRISPSSGRPSAKASLYCPVALADLKDADAAGNTRPTMANMPDNSVSPVPGNTRSRIPAFWAGAFCFGMTANGTVDINTVYLSSGNQIPSAIFRIQRPNEDADWGKPVEVLRWKTSIDALWASGANEAYFVTREHKAEGNAYTSTLYRLSDWTETSKVLDGPQGVWFRGLSVVPATKPEL
jgi:hypothetical protein